MDGGRACRIKPQHVSVREWREARANSNVWAPQLLYACGVATHCTYIPFGVCALWQAAICFHAAVHAVQKAVREVVVRKIRVVPRAAQPALPTHVRGPVFTMYTHKCLYYVHSQVSEELRGCALA